MATFKQFTAQGFEKIDHDLDYLLECAREVLEEIGEPEVASLLHRQLPDELNGVPSDKQAQALSLAFQLMNLVEENVANQVTRRRENEQGIASDPGMWGYWMKRIQQAGIDHAEITRSVAQSLVEPVLTSHPTEAKRGSVLNQHRRLYVAMVELENQMFTDIERVEIRKNIKALLELIWRSGEILVSKPDVASERRNVLYYLSEKFPVAMEIVDIRFREAMADAAVKWDPSDPDAYPHLRFGSWVGGDRDGHPFVTSEVTRETLEELRLTALQTLDDRLRALERNVALSVTIQQPSPAILKRISELSAYAPVEPSLVDEEPWCAFVRAMRLSLPLASGPRASNGRYRYPSEIRQDLLLLDRSLRELKGRRLANQFVLPVIRFVDTFGFHMAALDVRQNSAYHDKAMSQLLVAAGVEDGDTFADWSESRRVEFLSSELRSPRPFTHPSTSLQPEAAEAVAAYREVARHIETHGRAGIGRLIISMTRSLSDLLVAIALCREAGLTRMTPDGKLACLLPISPLFETLEDLHNSSSIMEAFLDHPVTLASLPYQSRRWDERIAAKDSIASISKQELQGLPLIQEAMLGYSDSNKDSGIIASQWGVREAQRKLLKIGESRGIQLRFFHGRGGTVSRGAGPTHRFLEALPPGSLATGARVTEQGEVIAQKYNNHLTAAHNLELLVAGTVGAQLTASAKQATEVLQAAMRQLSQQSEKAYRKLLNTERFLEFYRQATPIDALERSRIGSRPSRRSGKPSLQDLRAIPWVFSWNQSRFYLPGWFGVGAALAALREESPDLFQALKRDWQSWSFSRYLLFNIESNVESADPEVMRAYASLVQDESLRNPLLDTILTELDRSRRMLDEVLEGPLQKRRPRFYKTLHARDAWLDRLHRTQISLLRQWRQSREEEDLLNVLQSVNAIAAGLRTTG